MPVSNVSYFVLPIKLMATGREIPESLAEKTDRENEFPPDMWQKLGEAGFLGITVEEDYGGMAMGYQAHCVVMEELSRASGMISRSGTQPSLPANQWNSLNSIIICGALSTVCQPNTTPWHTGADPKISTQPCIRSFSRCVSNV